MALKIVGFVFEDGVKKQLSLAECAARELSESPFAQKSKGFVQWGIKDKSAREVEVKPVGLVTKFA